MQNQNGVTKSQNFFNGNISEFNDQFLEGSKKENFIYHFYPFNFNSYQEENQIFPFQERNEEKNTSFIYFESPYEIQGNSIFNSLFRQNSSLDLLEKKKEKSIFENSFMSQEREKNDELEKEYYEKMIERPKKNLNEKEDNNSKEKIIEIENSIAKDFSSSSASFLSKSNEINSFDVILNNSQNSLSSSSSSSKSSRGFLGKKVSRSTLKEENITFKNEEILSSNISIPGQEDNEINKRGPKKKPENINRKDHDKTCKDNVSRKIQVHYLTFLIKYINLKIEQKYKKKNTMKFQQLNYEYKKNISKSALNDKINKTIGEIIKTKQTMKNKTKAQKGGEGTSSSLIETPIPNENEIAFNEIYGKDQEITEFLDKTYIQVFKEIYAFSVFNKEREKEKEKYYYGGNIYFKDLIKKEKSKSKNEEEYKKIKGKMQKICNEMLMTSKDGGVPFSIIDENESGEENQKQEMENKNLNNTKIENKKNSKKSKVSDATYYTGESGLYPPSENNNQKMIDRNEINDETKRLEENELLNNFSNNQNSFSIENQSGISEEFLKNIYSPENSFNFGNGDGQNYYISNVIDS